jgi:hypothetical protein
MAIGGNYEPYINRTKIPKPLSTYFRSGAGRLGRAVGVVVVKGWDGSIEVSKKEGLT